MGRCVSCSFVRRGGVLGGGLHEVTDGVWEGNGCCLMVAGAVEGSGRMKMARVSDTSRCVREYCMRELCGRRADHAESCESRKSGWKNNIEIKACALSHSRVLICTLWTILYRRSRRASYVVVTYTNSTPTGTRICPLYSSRLPVR